MSEVKPSKNLVTEENIVSKVAELMETLDEVKKYDVVERHYKKFSLIVMGSIIVLLLASILLNSSNLLSPYAPPQRFFLSFLLVVIPTSAVVAGMLFVRKKITSVKTGEWKEELSHGFPSALKILSEMNWESSFESISSGGLGYAMYGLVKGIAYWIITYFALGFAFNITTYIVLQQTQVLGGASVWVSLLITFAYLKKDLSRRFNEIRAIDKLHWELRRLSYELRNAEF
jgi:hypothetical protein